MKEYKLRSECLMDIVAFVNVLLNLEGGSKIRIKAIDSISSIPDMEMTFSTILSKSEIISLLSDIDDSHVMIETLQPIELYTGLRI